MISIDDLVICENCLAEAADLLNLGDRREEAERLAALLEHAEADIEAKDRMIQRCLMTIDELANNPIKTRIGASRYVSISEEISNELEKRRVARGKVSRKIKEGQAKAKAKA